MADYAGDPAKQPPECQALGTNKMRCPNLVETYSGMDGERYKCAVCGEYFFLDYEEMR